MLQEKVQSDLRLENSLSRTKRLFTEYAMCNRFDLFVTFTFRPDVVDRYDLAGVKKKLTKFFDNFKQRKDPWFRYMVIPEQHKDGAWHFHGFMTAFQGMCCPMKIPKRMGGEVVYVPNTKGYIDFPAFSAKFGYFSASFIRDYEKTVNYCKSYITKSFQQVQFKNQRLLLKSAKLRKPERVYEGLDYMDMEADVENEFCKIKYCDEWETAPFFADFFTDLTLNYLPLREHADGTIEYCRKDEYAKLIDEAPKVLSYFKFHADQVEFEQLHIEKLREGG